MITTNFSFCNPVISEQEKRRMRPMGLLRKYLDSLNTKVARIELLTSAYVAEDVKLFLITIDPEDVMCVYQLERGGRSDIYITSVIDSVEKYEGIAFECTMLVCSDPEIQSAMAGVSSYVTCSFTDRFYQFINGNTQDSSADKLLGALVGVRFASTSTEPQNKEPEAVPAPEQKFEIEW